jgi:hypothetical protein
MGSLLNIIRDSTTMQSIVKELRDIVTTFSKRIHGIPDAEFSAKPLPRKWSKKEVLGHLIDSAQNNLRRFIVAQYEDVPSKIVYDQDFWVASNNYQNVPKDEIVILWTLMNFRIAAVLENMPESNYKKESMTSALHTLEFLADDYVKHMKHHLNQIIAGSFDTVYKS